MDDMAYEIEVLFEYKESRRQLCITRSEVCEAIEKELKSLGIQDDLVVSLSGSDEKESVKGSPIFLVQKWSVR